MDLDKISEITLYNIPYEPVNKCRLVVDEVARDLSRVVSDTVEISIIEGEFHGKNVGGTGTSIHWFVLLEEDSKKVIVDPTVNQFVKEKYDGTNQTSYVYSEKIPADGVVREEHTLFDAYEF